MLFSSASAISYAFEQKNDLTIVVQNFFDKVDVCEHHSTTTISFQTQGAEGLTFVHIILEILQVLIPFVADYFAAAEATDLLRQSKIVIGQAKPYRNDHRPTETALLCSWLLRD